MALLHTISATWTRLCPRGQTRGSSSGEVLSRVRLADFWSLNHSKVAL